MSWISILFIITLIINVFILYLLHNSHERNDKEPIKFPLFMYLLGIIVLLIPILNVAVTIFVICIIIANYEEGNIKLNEDFWLAKKY
jgi:RsiW-degrading membrane proteinase PrsW (M82 family)